ncbi:MAG: linear amide C-N hydrolase [Anaerolineales bacterium]|nr:linear amide C-N hydrolase [Anaerolineales bacterium]
MKKLGIAPGSLLVIAILLLIPFLDEARTLLSFKKVDDYPLYVMTFFGDYDYLEYLQEIRESASLEAESLEPSWACSVFSAAAAEGDLILGRNFDWYFHPALLLFADPPDGYASVSMVDLHYLGFERDISPTLSDRLRLLETPYFPFDGMNEHGLAVGMMAVSRAEYNNYPGKTTIGSLGAIRIMLDYAKDVDEAIALLQGYNIDFGSPPLHYLIADSNGDSAILEFLDGEMHVIRDSEPWQVSTNFLITTTHPEGSDAPCWRYRRAYEMLQEAEGSLTTMEGMHLLEEVSQSGGTATIWSIIYDRDDGEILIAVDRNYQQLYDFDLKP